VLFPAGLTVPFPVGGIVSSGAFVGETVGWKLGPASNSLVGVGIAVVSIMIDVWWKSIMIAVWCKKH